MILRRQVIDFAHMNLRETPSSDRTGIVVQERGAACGPFVDLRRVAEVQERGYRCTFRSTRTHSKPARFQQLVEQLAPRKVECDAGGRRDFSILSCSSDIPTPSEKPEDGRGANFVSLRRRKAVFRPLFALCPRLMMMACERASEFERFEKTVLSSHARTRTDRRCLAMFR